MQWLWFLVEMSSCVEVEVEVKLRGKGGGGITLPLSGDQVHAHAPQHDVSYLSSIFDAEFSSNKEGASLSKTIP